jgi:hypothetical protein
MHQFTGKIEIDGKIRYQAVEGWYDIIKEPSGLTSIEGQIKILSNESLDTISGNLIMDDGRVLKIMINRTYPIERLGVFIGSGGICSVRPDQDQ